MCYQKTCSAFLIGLREKDSPIARTCPAGLHLLVFFVSTALLVAIVCSCVGSSSLAASELPSDPAAGTPAELVEQLGHPDYYVRQAAEKELIRRRLDAYSAIAAAMESDDAEIAARAQRIFSRFENDFRQSESKNVRDVLDIMNKETDLVQKAWHLRYFADQDELPNGEGLPVLCRFLRFERDLSLRAEAAKAMIATPPVGPEMRKRWFQTSKAILGPPDHDPLLQLVIAAMDAFEAVEAAVHEVAFQGISEDIPSFCPEKIPMETREKCTGLIKRFREQLVKFHDNPEYHSLLPGSRNDILLYYALAELQQTIGLAEDVSESLATARGIVPGKPGSKDPYALSDLHAFSPWASHLEAASSLYQRGKLLWAEQEFQLTLQNAEGTHLMPFIRLQYADLLGDQEEYLRGAEQIDLAKDAAKKLVSLGVPIRDTASFEAKRDYFLAMVASETGDFHKARELADRVIRTQPLEIDALILRYRLEQKIPETDDAYRRETVMKIGTSIGMLEEMAINAVRTDSDPSKELNGIAWLFACTERSLEQAERCIRMALKERPEQIAYLDTLAHVQAAAGRIDEAVATQRLVVRRFPETKCLRSNLNRFLKQRESAGKSAI